jgi:hypothetical protein
LPQISATDTALPGAPLRLVLTPERLARALVFLFVGLFSMNALVLVVAHGLGHPLAKGFVPLFHVDYESNLPTFAAFLLLISCTLTAAWTSALETGRPRHRRAWTFISVLFLFLAADEAFSFHEQVSTYLNQEFSSLGLPLYAWVVPYGLAVAGLGTFLLRWFLELDRSLQRTLMLAGSIFLSGALGLELVSSNYYESLSPDREVFRTLTGDLLATLEEACEFAGLSIFLHALVTRLGGISFRALDVHI